MWSEKFEVGVTAIDDQHKQLFALIAELRDGCRAGQSNDLIVDVLKGVVQYTHEHFSMEEMLMRQHGYPDYVTHRAIHQQLMIRANELLATAQRSPTVGTLDTSRFLREWLEHHISGTDKRLAEFLIQRSAAARVLGES